MNDNQKSAALLIAAMAPWFTWAIWHDMTIAALLMVCAAAATTAGIVLAIPDKAENEDQ